MNRRDLLAAAACAAGPLPGWSQARNAARKPAESPVVGFLHTNAAEATAPRVAAFLRGLGEAGYVEGQNIRIEFRWAEGDFGRLPALAADLVRHGVDVIATPGNTGAALAAKAATSSIPIVFGVSDDPVKFGLVASLARPGGNATGMNFLTSELVAKRMGLLREMAPRAARVAVLVNPSNATNAEGTMQEAELAGRAMGVQTLRVEARTSAEIDTALGRLKGLRSDALFVGPDAYFQSRREQLARLAQRAAIPSSYSVRDYADAGGLMSYGPDVVDMFRFVGSYAGRILKGEKPSQMPVVQPTRFELVINLKTAKALGLGVPHALLLRADEVIE